MSVRDILTILFGLMSMPLVCERSRQMRTAFTENENGRAACVC